jgi:RNA polymerase sigma factor (sigma-70 family)
MNKPGVVLTGLSVEGGSAGPGQHFLINWAGRAALLPVGHYLSLLRFVAAADTSLPLPEPIVAAFEALTPHRPNGQGHPAEHNGSSPAGTFDLPNLCFVLDPSLLLPEAPGAKEALSDLQDVLSELQRVCPVLDPSSMEHLETQVLHQLAGGAQAAAVWSVISSHRACLDLFAKLAWEEARHYPRDNRADSDLPAHLCNGAWLKLSVRFSVPRPFPFNPAQGRLEPWLSSTISTACHEVLRGEWRKKRPEAMSDLSQIPSSAEEDERWDRLELRARVTAAIDELPADLKIVATMRRQGYTLEKIGQELQRSKAWAHRKMQAALLELRKKLGATEA